MRRTWRLEASHLLFLICLHALSVSADGPVFSLEVVSKSQSEIEIQLTMLNSSATIQSIDSIECAKERDRTLCPLSPNVVISGSNANLAFDSLDIGESYRVAVFFVVYELGGVNQNSYDEVTLSTCTVPATPPADDVDWYSWSTINGTNFELPDFAFNYEITLVPTFCTGNKTLVHPEWLYPPIIYNLETGCEYRVLYAGRCETRSGEKTPSEYVEFSKTFCAVSKPRAPNFDDPNIRYTATNTSITINDGGLGTVGSPSRSVGLDRYLFVAAWDDYDLWPRVGVAEGWVNVDEPMTVTGLLPGRVYSVTVIGQLNSSYCGNVNGTRETVIRDLCTVPSPPNMDYSWALAAYDDTTLKMVPPFISSPSGERSDEFKVLSVHPAPNTPFNPNTSDYYSSVIYIRNLTASTRYTVSVVSTLGGNGSYATPCKTAPSDPLESEVVQFVACTAPPQPNVTWESYETSVTVTLHTPSHLFDYWKLEIFSLFNGTFREISLNSSQSAYTFDGLTYGVNYEIYVWLQIGGDVGLTDCGPVGAAFSHFSLLYVSAGCNSQPVVLHQIEAKSRWTISINFISFYYWDSLVIVSSSSSLTNPIMNKTLDLYFGHPNEIDGLYPGTQYYLHFIQLVQFCPSGDRKFNDTTSACTIPDYINSSVTQIGFDSGAVFFSGISGVLDGSFSSMYYSLTSDDNLCSEREGNFTDLTVRHNIENVVTDCTYQLSISAQCGSERGPPTHFTIYVSETSNEDKNPFLLLVIVIGSVAVVALLVVAVVACFAVHSCNRNKDYTEPMGYPQADFAENQVKTGDPEGCNEMGKFVSTSSETPPRECCQA